MIKNCLHVILCINLLVTLSSYKLILTTPLSTCPQYIVGTMFMKNSPSSLTHLWPTLAYAANQGPIALIRLCESHKICIWKATQNKKEHLLLLTVDFGGHYAARPSFLGNRLPNHPESQVVLSAHSPSQACRNRRGKMQFITGTSGNKYSVSLKNISATTKN